MATNKRKENFVSKIVKDPANPPKTILLAGYLGEASEPGHTRLYFDAQLNSYVEIPNDAILHEEEMSSTPPGQSYVWIKQDAQVIHGEAGPQRTKSSFFEGPIAEAAARAPKTLPRHCYTVDLTCRLPPPQTTLLTCPVTDQFHVCQTPVVPCQVESALCPPPPTPLRGCPVTSPFHVCQTPVIPCELETARCPPRTTPQAGCLVTSPFHVCQTPVVPCELETARCPVESAICFPRTQIGCFVTQNCPTQFCGR